MKHKKRMGDFDERLSPDAECLDKYLSRYKDSIRVKNLLERRRDNIREEFSPLKSPKLDGLPRGGSVSETPVTSVLVRIEEIENRIRAQIMTASKIFTETMDIIDLLPEGNYESALMKVVIENKYIDHMDMDRIARENNFSRSTVKRYWKKGLYVLLDCKKVKKILEDYRDEQDGEFFVQNKAE